MKATSALIFLGMMAASVGGSMILPQAAHAGVACNYHNRVLFVAAAYLNQDQIWVSEGWWQLDPGACLNYPDNWYTYLQYDRDTAAERPSVPAANQATLCVVQDRFVTYNAISNVACENNNSDFGDAALRTYISIGNNREIVKKERLLHGD